MSGVNEGDTYDQLWLGLRRATDNAFDAIVAGDLEVWRQLPEPEGLPSPWVTWTLIGLVRHRHRQKWVAEIVTERLGVELRLLAKGGGLAHPRDRPQWGPVPGLEEWEYRFHGISCCLTHRLTGESIDVDFHGDHAEGFDLFFYLAYLESLRQPQAPEQRLMALHPSLETVGLAFDTLQSEGMLVRVEDRGLRLSAAMLEHEQGIDAFCETWGAAESLQRAWMAALVGDWLAAREGLQEAGYGSLAALAGARAEGIRHERTLRLLETMERRTADVALVALNDLGAAEIPALLSRALTGEPSGLMSSAMQIIENRPDANDWRPAIYALATRLDPDSAAPSPYLWAKCVGLLLRRGHRMADVLTLLPQAGPHASHEAALLALEYAPSLALGLFRDALRSPVPNTRATAAAALALVDRPWSWAELLGVLAESRDHEATSECRAALVLSRDPHVRWAARDWEMRHPSTPERGSFVGVEEWLAFEMDELRERVLSLADRELPSL